MTFRDGIRDIAASSSLEMAKQFGETIEYSHEGADYVTLYTIPNAENTTYESSDDVDSDVTTKTFTIPLQTGFPPLSGVITTLDTIRYNSVLWTLKSFRKNSLGSSYKIEFKRTRATNINGA